MYQSEMQQSKMQHFDYGATVWTTMRITESPWLCRGRGAFDG